MAFRIFLGGFLFEFFISLVTHILLFFSQGIFYTHTHTHTKKASFFVFSETKHTQSFHPFFNEAFQANSKPHTTQFDIVTNIQICFFRTSDEEKKNPKETFFLFDFLIYIRFFIYIKST